jgi:hypothetical protein
MDASFLKCNIPKSPSTSKSTIFVLDWQDFNGRKRIKAIQLRVSPAIEILQIQKEHEGLSCAAQEETCLKRFQGRPSINRIVDGSFESLEILSLSRRAATSIVFLKYLEP